METKTKMLCAVPFILLVLVYAVGSNISFKASLTPDEQEVVDFSPEDLSLPSVEKAGFVPVRNTLITVTGPETPDTAAIGTKRARQQDKEYRLRMIVIGERGRMASINNRLFREGDRSGDMVVRRIEKDRVQVRLIELDAAGETRDRITWLYLEDIR